MGITGARTRNYICTQCNLLSFPISDEGINNKIAVEWGLFSCVVSTLLVNSKKEVYVMNDIKFKKNQRFKLLSRNKSHRVRSCLGKNGDYLKLNYGFLVDWVAFPNGESISRMYKKVDCRCGRARTHTTEERGRWRWESLLQTIIPLICL